MQGIVKKSWIAGQAIEVAIAPRTHSAAVPAGVYRVLRSLMTGLKVTLGYLVRPSTVVTQQYPENRDTLKLPERYRSELRLIDDNGYHRCPGCKICEKACPNGSIKIMARKGTVTGKTELDQFVWRLDTCTFCYACVQSCPFDAIEFTGRFENAVFDKRLLVYNLNTYKGPPAKVLLAEADKEKVKTMLEPLARFAGPTPLGGTDLAGSPAGLGGCSAGEVQVTNSQAATSKDKTHG